MQYQSPIRFLEYAGIDPEQVAPEQLSRYKKLVAAEFALQPEGIITLDGISYTRHEVLKVLEQPDFTGALYWHRLVWQHKNLLDLLERDALDMNHVGSWQHLKQLDGFVAFLSPYFGPAFNSVMKTLLQSNNLYTASVWMDYYAFVLPAEGEEATRAMRLYLDEAIRLFRNLNEQSYRERIGELQPWIDESWNLFINKLPDPLLHYVDELANVIINFTVRIQKKDRKVCYLISSELIQLQNVNYSLRQLIRGNHAIYKQNYKNAGIKRILPRIPFAYFAVMALIALLRSFSQSDSSEHFTGESSYELTKDYSQILEKIGFRDMRNYYDRQFQAYRTAASGGNRNKELSNSPFSGKDMYLLIESSADTTKDLYPLAIRNNTPLLIQVFVMRSGSVFNLEIDAYKTLSLDPQPGTNTDLVLAFSPRKELNSGGLLDSANLQYLHIAPDAGKPYHKIDFLPDMPVELPLLGEDQLKKLPLLITIDRKGDHNYFRVEGRGQTVNFKTIP